MGISNASARGPGFASAHGHAAGAESLCGVIGSLAGAPSWIALASDDGRTRAVRTLAVAVGRVVLRGVACHRDESHGQGAPLARLTSCVSVCVRVCVFLCL